MTIAVEGLGPFIDLAKAIGIVGADGQLDTTWFAAPGDHIDAMLRNPAQREALLRASNQLIERGAPPLDDASGKRWLRLFVEGGVSLHLVVGTVGTTTEIGLGVRLTTTAPDSETQVYIPLLHVPASGPVTIAFIDGSASITIASHVTLDPVLPPPGETGLQGFRVTATVATNGTAPTLAFSLLGLQLPGQTVPSDVTLGGDLTQLGDEALRLLLGIVQQSVAGAVGDLAELLALVGITDDPAIPQLPIAELIARGVPAWQSWLDGLVGSPTALAAWLDHLRRLLGHGAVVDAAASPGLPNRIRWTLGNGLTLSVVLRVARTAAGAPLIEFGIEAGLSTIGPPPGAVELSATLTRITLGATPSIEGLPVLEIAARLGPRIVANPADRLLNLADPEPRVGSLRTGFALSQDKRLAFVLAAHDVVIGTHEYPVLDLTNTQTLADVGGAIVSDIATAVLARLGAAGAAVQVLSGLAAPPNEPAWPPALLTTLPDLLADPVHALVGYHARVLSSRRAGYASVLEPLRELLAPAGFVRPITGTGTEGDPWRLELALGVGVLAWTAATTLELGIAAEKSLPNLGGGCPTATVRVVARIASIALNGSGGHAVPGAFAQVVFGARGDVPLRIGDATATLVADSAGVELRWDRVTGLGASVLVPGLSAIVDGEAVPVALPTLAADGTLVGDVPWRAFELLLGHVLNLLGQPWTDKVTRLLGWIPMDGAASVGRLPLEALVHDPVATVRAWAEARVRQGDLEELVRSIALAVSGPAAPGLHAGVYRGRGDALSPFAIPLSAAGGGATRRIELQLWSAGPTAHALPEQPSVADLAAGTDRIVAALHGAAANSQAIADALVDRHDLSSGLAALATWWTDSDGLVRAVDAVLPGATAHELANVSQDALPGVNIGDLCGFDIDQLTMVVVGPQGPDSWRGVAIDHVIDMRTAGLVPEAFDLSRIATEDGPWLVRLASRADSAVTASDDGATRQTGRLARVVDAVAARAGVGEGVTIIAHGAAGHAAAAVANRTGVSRLVTLGTPHGGIDLSVLESQPMAGALQLLAALVPPADRNRAQSEATTRGRGLLEALLNAYNSTAATLADLAPPATPPTIPAGVDVRCVQGHHDGASVSSAIGALASHALEKEIEGGLAAGASAYVEAVAALGAGFSVAIDPPAAPGELHLTVELSLTGTIFSSAGSPGLRARIGIGRVGGWLAGGPDPSRPGSVSRHPSLRRADIEIDLHTDGSASAQLVFHEANALGVARRRWVVNQTAVDTLLPEARVLVGRMAAGLGPIPGSGLLRELADLFDVLGLVDSTTPVTTGVQIGLSVDGIRRLIVDPVGLFTDAASQANAGRLALALSALLGGAAPAVSTPTQFEAPLEGVAIRVDVLARTIRVSAPAIALPSGVSASGTLELRTDGTLTYQLSLALGSGDGPNGRPVLDVVAATPPRLSLRWEGAGSAFPASIELSPVPNVPALSQLLTTVVPAYVLWAGLSFVRSLQPGAVALIDPMLRAAGLLTGIGASERVVVPFALIADPVHWITHASILGDSNGAADVQRIRGLLDVFARMVGIPQPAGGGAWQLPYGLELTARTETGRPALALSLDNPIANTGVRVAGSIALALPSNGLPASPIATLLLALPDGTPLDSAGRIAISVGASGLTIRLILPGSNVDLQLVPGGAGLADLGGVAAAAATYALPFVLDAIAGVPVGHPARVAAVALANVGDALALRTNGQFNAAQIQSLAANPAPQLAQRLAQNLPAAIDALAALLAPATPANYSVARSGSDLLFRHTGAALPFEVRITVPVGSPTGARLTATISNVVPFTGTTIGASLTVDANGLDQARVSFAVSHANGIDLGPVTLAPIAEVVIGSATPGGARVSVGLAVDATRSVSGVLHLTPTRSFGLEPTGGTLADNITRLVLPPAFDIALSTAAVTDLLDLVVLGGPTIRQLLDGVVFAGNNFDVGVLDLAQLWTRLLRLAANVAGHAPSITIDKLTLSIAARAVAGDQVYGVSLSLAPGERYRLVDADVKVDLEVDASWITGGIAEGLLVELLRIHGAAPQPFFGISVGGVGVRFSKASGPLLDTFITVDSIALHGLIAVDLGGVTAGGGQLELGNFSIGLGSAGGSNKVAAGILKDSASGAERPEPKFSPALSVQRHGAGALQVDVRAGTGAGPWWITIQRGFGPVYIEQVGFGVTRAGESIIAARVIVDGKVSLLGLTVAVDDLAVGAHWPQVASDPPLYDPGAWEVDLAGLAVSAETSSVSITGGLRRAPGPLPDYLGMVSIRFSVYAISAFGGYAVVIDNQGQFTSLFIFGAVNAPIGGVPAFFVTGLGAGVGVNRRLLLPSDLNDFPSYPLLQALDRNSSMANPDTALDALRAYFPSSRGAFWFAAGLSFNSFSLVDGILVVAVAIADGLDINILGLARAGIPNPSAPLVQVELALVARFSSREGVLWIQAQLTDNSFLLTRDCRLTGGFAYVMWFKGDKAGEFVLTLGGFHPSFHRDGYPVVPRLGFVWSVASFLVIKGESYFALTSEAIMVGTRFEASLTLGPLWAYLRLGVDGIVYFDPFHFEVTAFAELGAGITIDIDLGWFGHIRITISIHLHADVLLEGPEFRGRATIDLDVTSATISFGNWSDRSTSVLAWPAFEAKYIRPGGAAVITVVPGRGTLPPSTAEGGKPPTGGASDPFLVLPEFTLTVTTTAATTVVEAAGPRSPGFRVLLAIGPMHLASVRSILTLTVQTPDTTEFVDRLDPKTITGQFPKGAWGPQPQSEPKPVPTGDTVEAVNGATLTSEAIISVGTVAIDSNQVDIGPRLQLPFLVERDARAQHAADVAAANAYVLAAPTAAGAVLDVAHQLRTQGPNGSTLTPLAEATFRSERSAPPQLVPLTYRMAIDPPGAVKVPPAKAPQGREPVDTRARAPRLHSVLTIATTIAEEPKARTSVGAAGDGMNRVTPRRLAEVQAALDPRLPAELVVASPTAAQKGETIIAAVRAPATGRAGAGGELRRKTGQAPWRTKRLDAFSDALVRDGADLVGGELAVLTTDNGHYDVDAERPSLDVVAGAPLRIVTLDTAGNVTLDVTAKQSTIAIPAKTDRIALIAGGSTRGSGAAGWHSGSRLAQIGARTLVGSGCTVVTSDVVTRRRGVRVATGFVVAADAVDGYSIVSTQLPAGVNAIAIVLEPSARVDGDRGDVLELGISGANRVIRADGEPMPPMIVAAGGRTINVYAVEPDGSDGAIEVTVATGEHLHLGGVIGARTGAAALAESLSRRDLGAVVGQLIDAPQGKAHVRWLPQRPPTR